MTYQVSDEDINTAFSQWHSADIPLEYVNCELAASMTPNIMLFR